MLVGKPSKLEGHRAKHARQPYALTHIVPLLRCRTLLNQCLAVRVQPKLLLLATLQAYRPV